MKNLLYILLAATFLSGCNKLVGRAAYDGGRRRCFHFGKRL